jgi:tetratricopeptide (TPR) repeat protein
VFAKDLQDARTVVVDGADGAPMLLVFANSWQFRPYRFALFEEATERDPSLFEGHFMAASGYIGAIERSDDPSCHWANLPKCVEATRRHILALDRIAPDKSTATELVARLLAATGRIGQALSLLSNRCASFTPSANCWALRIELGRAEIAGPEYTHALRAYYAAACTSSSACIHASVFLAGALRARSDYLGALEYYGKAVEAGANTADVWMALAAVARAAGQPNRATEALKKAQRAARGDANKEAQVETALRKVLPANLKEQPSGPATP